MKCLDNLIQYNIDHMKAITGDLKTLGNGEGFKNPRKLRGFQKPQAVAGFQKPQAVAEVQNPK